MTKHIDEHLKKALKEVCEELKSMPREEFFKLLDSYQDSDVARLLAYGMDPTMFDDKEEKND